MIGSATRGLRSGSRGAVSPLTTTVYTHPSDEEIYQRVRGLSC